MDKTNRARGLRREQTDAEHVFWIAVRNRNFRGLKFKRQVPIGRYFADFVCESEKVIVELDGDQHALTGGYDKARTATLEQFGYRVLRFWNSEVLKDVDQVLFEVGEYLDARSE